MGQGVGSVCHVSCVLCRGNLPQGPDLGGQRTTTRQPAPPLFNHALDGCVVCGVWGVRLARGGWGGGGTHSLCALGTGVCLCSHAC